MFTVFGTEKSRTRVRDFVYSLKSPMIYHGRPDIILFTEKLPQVQDAYVK